MMKPVPENSDLQLIQAYLAGDSASLELLFTRYLRPIYGYVAGIVGRTEADDAVQETFVRVWKHLHTFDRDRVFKTWLYRIAHNAALDLLKKKRPMAFSELDKPDEGIIFEQTLEDQAESISVLLDREASADRLRTALSALPVHQRTVLSLHYIDEMTFAEIGKVLDEPLDTVKSRARRALLSLKQRLEAEDRAPIIA
jgi:RNA polymerase sigma-70 factor (ECF subfamily)